MPIETASYFSELVATNPPQSEPVGEGDNHLRLIKDVLKKTFTGGATGLSGPVTVTHTELNRLAGISANIQTSITALNSLTATHTSEISTLQSENTAQKTILYAPVGTQMLFYQNAAPPGWTAQAEGANRLAITSPFGGGFLGGTNEATVLNLDHNHTTGDFTLAASHIPAHTHLAYYNADGGLGGGGGTVLSVSGVAGSTGSAATSSTGSGSSHNHGVTSVALSDWQPRYHVYLRCRKN